MLDRRAWLARTAAVGGAGSLFIRPMGASAQSASSPGRFDVRAFGAVGDGEQDDSVPVQDAVDAAGEAGGGLVVFPPGRYRLTTAVEVDRPHVRIVGFGPASRLFQSVDREHGVRITAPDCGVCEVFLEGTGVGVADGSGGSGVIFTGDGDRGTTRNVTSFNFGTAGFDSHNVQFTRFLDCRALCNGGDNSMGFWVRHDTAPTFALLSGVHAADALFEGIQLETCRNATVSDFSIEHCKDGLAFTSGTLPTAENRVVNGEIRGCTAAGIYLNGLPERPAEFNILSSIVIRETGSDARLHHGVVVDAHSSGNVFAGVIARSSAARGLQDDGPGNLYNGCHFDGNGDSGMVLRNTSDTRVIGCLARRNGGHGIHFEEAPARVQIVAFSAVDNAGWGAFGLVQGGRLDLAGAGNARGLDDSSGWSVGPVR